jgi:hypothetical protein
MWSWLGQVPSLIATASLIPIRARGTSPTRQKTPSRRYLEVRTLLDVWLGWRRFWIGSDVWSVRPRVTSSVITARSSADLKRPPLVVVLHSPFVAADYAEQISHGSPSSTSAWMALTLHGSGVPVSKCAGVPWLLNVAAPHRCLCRHQIVRTDGTGGRRTLQRNCHAEDECGH